MGVQSTLAANRHCSNTSRGQTTFSIFMITSGRSLWASNNTVGRRHEMTLELPGGS